MKLFIFYLTLREASITSAKVALLHSLCFLLGYPCPAALLLKPYASGQIETHPLAPTAWYLSLHRGNMCILVLHCLCWSILAVGRSGSWMCYSWLCSVAPVGVAGGCRQELSSVPRLHEQLCSTWGKHKGKALNQEGQTSGQRELLKCTLGTALRSSLCCLFAWLLLVSPQTADAVSQLLFLHSEGSSRAAALHTYGCQWCWPLTLAPSWGWIFPQWPNLSGMKRSFTQQNTVIMQLYAIISARREESFLPGRCSLGGMLLCFRWWGSVSWPAAGLPAAAFLKWEIYILS